jgi:CRISPR-associated endonuclease/helicase Cas3
VSERLAIAYAHTLEGMPETAWELYDSHRDAVAWFAEKFTEPVGEAAWGRWVGHWHDLGKLQPVFQEYLRGRDPKGTPHAWVGALLSANRDPRRLLPAVFAIAAHHGSLANLKTDEANGIDSRTTLQHLLATRKSEFGTFRLHLPSDALDMPLPSLPVFVEALPPDLRKLELFTRFLFSALVDADRLATSAFYAGHTGQLSAADLAYDPIDTLSARLDSAIDAMPARGSDSVMGLRRDVLNACRDAAAKPPGRFSLTVPTGGGKTLSAMSFALRHAGNHGLRRVIVVIPYTSIIEQSARVYRNVLNDPARPEINNVLEHHSNLDEQKLTEQDARGEDLRKLAAENWDAPVVVTTTVQFLESLLAAHGSRCRKVHNIARSVILLDEVQTLPPQFLETVVDVLGQLTDFYGSSLVLSTATPPALKKRADILRPGLSDVREIIRDPSTLALSARRVKIEWRIGQPTAYADLADEIRRHERVLAIVHRRDDARTLAELVGDGVLHLSALMCPAHRLHTISQVLRHLAAKERCVLVSTQLIEAGVDVDFPVVYRALAGLDSIAQSAGRCDREGRLTEAVGAPAGRMVVFRAETDPPPGVPRKAMESMSVLLKLGSVDPFDPKDSERYFDELYRKIDHDQHGVEPLRRALAFAAVEERFRIIDAEMFPIVVPWGPEPTLKDREGHRRLEAYRRSPSRQTRRALQPYTVQVRRYAIDRLRDAGICSPIDDRNETSFFDALNEGRESSYHERFGLDEKASTDLAPEISVI